MKDLRRNACPSLEAPMQTGDGLLVRIQLTAPCDPAEFASLCDLATENGNGIFEVTSRGSLQFRGFDAASAQRFASSVAVLNLPLSSGTVVETGPFAHERVQEIAHQIRDALFASQLKLAPKFTIVIVDASPGAPSVVSADIAVIPGSDDQWDIAHAGAHAPATYLTKVKTNDVTARVIELCCKISELGPNARGRDFAPSGDGGDGAASALLGGHAKRPIGVFRVANTVALGLRMPHGASETKTMSQLCRTAHGENCDLRFGAGKALYFVGSEQSCRVLRENAKSLGFIVDEHDARLLITTCAGAPACGSAHYASRSLAKAIDGKMPSLLDGSITLHFSACEKRCACRSEENLLLVGTADGLEISFEGEEIGTTEFSRAERTLNELQRFVAEKRKAGETAKVTMKRLGRYNLAAAFGRN